MAKIRHIAIRAEDVEQTATFFQEAFGLQLVQRRASGPIDLTDGDVNITLLPLPPRSPELNPVENIWQFVRDNWLSNRVFGSYEQIVEYCCDAWNRLMGQPWMIMSIGLRDWAHGF